MVIDLPFKYKREIVLEENTMLKLIEKLQEIILDSISLDESKKKYIPIWTTQYLIYSLYKTYAKDFLGDMYSFIEFSKLIKYEGSKIFEVEINLETYTKDRMDLLLDDINLISKAVLIGRSIEYGRTLIWSGIKGKRKKSRDLLHVKNNGVFFTPYAVAAHMAESILSSLADDQKFSVCDPAVGAGGLLIPFAQIYRQRWPNESILPFFYGVDIEPISVEATSIVLSAICGEWNLEDNIGCSNENFRVGDSYGGYIKNDHNSNVSDFVWSIEFPKIFSYKLHQQGFDIVVTNPPYGRYKTDSDWATAKEMSISVEQLNMIREERSNRAIGYKTHPDYSLSTKGIIDKSRIGIERAMMITRQDGALGVIAPSTLAADDSSAALRNHLLDNWTILEINELPEDSKWFYGVNQALVVVLAAKRKFTSHVPIRSGIKSQKDLGKPFDGNWSVSTIRSVSAKSPIPIRAAKAENIIRKIHENPSLREYKGIYNMRGEVDITSFREYISYDESQLPLVRGDQIDSFVSNLLSEKPAYVDRSAFNKKISRKKLSHLMYPRIVGRQCSYIYRKQRLSFTIIPSGRAVANSCNYIIVQDLEFQMYLLGIFNSRLMNWRFKLINSNNHVSNSEIDDFPIPKPSLRSINMIEEIITISSKLSDNYEEDLYEELNHRVYEIYGLTDQEIKTLESTEDK